MCCWVFFYHWVQRIKRIWMNKVNLHPPKLFVQNFYKSIKIKWVGWIFWFSLLFPACLQKLQQELEFLEVQEEYIKDEQKNLKKEFLHAQEEVKRIQSIPLVIGQFLEAVDQNTAIVGSTTGKQPVTNLKLWNQTEGAVWKSFLLVLKVSSETSVRKTLSWIQ